MDLPDIPPYDNTGLARFLLSHLPKAEGGPEGVRERHKPTSSNAISHSAGPVLRIEQSIRSEIAAISPCVDELMLFIKKCRCAPGSEIDVEISLREALANAVVHGNHEDRHKHVYVGCCCMPNQEVTIVVRDEGKGFSRTELPNPTNAERLESTHGRGVYLMTTLMDEVHFDRGGAEVNMRKRPTKGNHPGAKPLW